MGSVSYNSKSSKKKMPFTESINTDWVQSIKLIAKLYKYFYLCFIIRELIDMSIDFNVISMTSFGHFQLIRFIFGLLWGYTIQIKSIFREIKWFPCLMFINVYHYFYNNTMKISLFEVHIIFVDMVFSSSSFAICFLFAHKVDEIIGYEIFLFEFVSFGFLNESGRTQ